MVIAFVLPNVMICDDALILHANDGSVDRAFIGC
jgi:hypothetical protein